MAHGGMRQKNFNVYEETLRVPLVFSNPRLFPEPRRATPWSRTSICCRPWPACSTRRKPRAPLAGRRLLALCCTSPPRRRPHAGLHRLYLRRLALARTSPQLVPPPNHIISIREERYKLARYYDGDGIAPDQWEMYDLETDPHERVNLAFPGSTPTPSKPPRARD